MAIHSVDYLNARRARMPAAGGKTYTRAANPVDQRARDAELDAGELLHEQAMSAPIQSRRTRARHSGSPMPCAKPIGAM
jgi:hypothetical protein